MAIKINNITDETHQRHLVIVDEQEVTVVLRFLPVVERWVVNVSYAGRELNGTMLALNTLHMQSANFPFDFIVSDLTGRGVDPFRRDDFSDDRCALFMLEAEDMAEIRGQNVPV